MLQNYSQHVAFYRAIGFALGLVALVCSFVLATNGQPPPQLLWKITIGIPSTGDTLTYTLKCYSPPNSSNETSCRDQTDPKEITILLKDEVEWCTDKQGSDIWIIHQNAILDDENNHATHLHHGKDCLRGATDQTANIGDEDEYYVGVVYSNKGYVGIGDPRIIVGGGFLPGKQISKIQAQLKVILQELEALKNELKTKER